MYTSYIGDRFLRLFKQVRGKPESYTAKDFFDEEYAPLFFNDERHMIHVGNSPFFQKPRSSDVQLHGGRTKAQLYNFYEKVESSVPSGAIYVGYGAEEIKATSSGQITSMKLTVKSEEMYSSWLGQALGVGVSGAMVMLIDQDDILWRLYEGWVHYQSFLQQTKGVKDKQIETWNGWWLFLNSTNGFSLKSVPYHKIPVDKVQSRLAITTVPWSQAILALSRLLSEKRITAYCYALSQTNVTLGFINTYLHEIRNLHELRRKIFIDQQKIDDISEDDIKHLETFYNLKNACRKGTIGLTSLEPQGLRAFMPKGTYKYAQGKEFNLKENNRIDFELYKIWIIAMLNKTELLDLASDLAQALRDYETHEKKTSRGKTTEERAALKVREAKTISILIEGMTKILESDVVDGTKFRETVKEVLAMPSDQFPLFITLVRFEYTYIKTQNI